MFLRADDAAKNKVGSHERPDIQIYTSPRVSAPWWVTGVGEENGYMEKVLNAARDRLLVKYCVALLSTCHTEYPLGLGESTPSRRTSRKTAPSFVTTSPGSSATSPC